MRIEVSKTYLTNKGARLRIIAVDRWNRDLPIVALKLRKGGTRETGEGVVCLNAEGTENVFIGTYEQEHIVREISVWDDLPRDTLMWVQHPYSNTWLPRYFWGVAYDEPRVYDSGRTSLTIAEGGTPVERQTGDKFVRNYTTAFTIISLIKPER